MLLFALGESATSFFSIYRMRVAWAFALSLNGTAAAVLLFAAPKIRDSANISLTVGLLPCLVLAAIVVLHAMSPGDISR